MKKEDLWFCEWEGEVFGSGYGSGELPILKVLKIFFHKLNDGRSYDYKELEQELGDAVTWLLINALNKANEIEWGTSARHGWLTLSGECLRDYFKGKNPQELYEILMSDHEPICCCRGNIKDKGHEECGKNPFLNENIAWHSLNDKK